MSLETIITRLKTIEENITGVKKAFDAAPESVASGDLPVVLNVSDSGEFSIEAGGYGRTDHTIRILLLVTPRTDLAADEAKVRPFVKRFRDAFAAAVKLDGLSTVAHAELTSYRYGAITYGESEYAGIEFTLEVTEKEAISVEA